MERTDSYTQLYLGNHSSTELNVRLKVAKVWREQTLGQPFVTTGTSVVHISH